MPNYITIDGGTTNTRISLVAENKTVDIQRLSIGAKNGIDDKAILKQALRQSITGILEKNGMRESDIKRILASGMITSELGLINLPHIPAPVGIEQLHNSLYETVMEDISSIPFIFVPGVKSHCENLEKCDMMRGEETEFIGLFRGEGFYILPGSHSKIITADKDQRIIAFQTMLTGEMIAALSQHTILKDSINLAKGKTDREYLLKGYEFCKANGINQSLFKVRVLKNLFNKNESQIYSFFMGVILCDEIEQILCKNPKRIIIGGKAQIKEALAILLESTCSATIETIRNEEAEQSPTQGIIKIYEFANKARQLCNDYPLNRGEIERKLLTVPYKSNEQLIAASESINAFTAYIYPEHNATLKKEETLSAVLAYIDSNLSSDLSTHALCKHFYVSKTVLYEITKPVMPEGIAKYIRNKRMSKAKELLANTDASIGEISNMVGFVDSNYFRRLFKQLNGMSANAYRKRHGKTPF